MHIGFKLISNILLDLKQFGQTFLDEKVCLIYNIGLNILKLKNWCIQIF